MNAINISLDTLKEDKFEYMTRRKGFKQTISGLKQAIETNFESVKVNCVLMKDFNDDEISDFVNLARANPIEVRFIEFMPFFENKWDSSKVITGKQTMEIIKDRYGIELCRLPKSADTANDVSKVYSAPDMLGRIGFISSMSDNFCSGCNRLRVTADGNFKNCLFGHKETSLRDLLRNGANDLEIVKSIQSSLAQKWIKHPGEF